MDGGGQYTGRAHSVFTSGAAVDLLQADPRRVGVVLSVAAGFLTNFAVVASGGITGEFRFPLVTSQPPVEHYFSRHGPLPSCHYRLLAGAPGATISVYELLLLG